MFGNNQDVDDANVNDDDKESLNNEMERDQAAQDHINNIPDNKSILENSTYNQDSTHSESNHGSDNKYGDESDNHFDDFSTEDNLDTGRPQVSILRELQPRKGKMGLDESK